MLKKLFILLLIGNMLCYGGYITSTIVVGNATSAAQNTTGATLICAIISDGTNTAGSTAVITDNKGNTWNAGGSTGEAWIKCAYGVGLTVGTGHTITVTGGTGPGGGDTQVSFVAFSGFTGPVETGKYATATHSFSGSPFPIGPITPASNGALVLTGFFADSSAGSSGTPYAVSGFTIFASASVGWGIGAGYVVQGTATSVTPSWTFTGLCFCGAFVASYPAIAAPSVKGFPAIY